MEKSSGEKIQPQMNADELRSGERKNRISLYCFSISVRLRIPADHIHQEIIDFPR
jgi:hypothetical protein